MPPEFAIGAVVQFGNVKGRIIALWHNGFTIREGGHGSMIYTVEYSDEWDVLDGVTAH